MGTLVQDLRYGLRNLMRRPGFTIATVLVLALGIGANTAIFSVVNTVMLRPLPYPESDKLVTVWEDNRRQGWPEDITGYSTFTDWKTQGEHFQSMAAYHVWNPNLTGQGEAERLRGAMVTDAFFEVLGLSPMLGHTLQRGDEPQGAESSVVLSHGLWQRRFGGDPSIVGRTVRLNARPFVVAGVMPPELGFPSKRTELWVLLRKPAEEDRGSHSLAVIGRLKPGSTLLQAEAQLETVMRRLETQYPDAYTGFGANLVGLHENLVGDVRPALLMLLGAVLFVLLIACANVANLLLARTAAREREMSVRAALGASGGRLLRQLLTESTLLGLLGGVVGLGLAMWGIDSLARLGPADLPRLDEIRVDVRVLGFTLAASLFTGLLFGLAPALQWARPDLNRSLRVRDAGVGGRRLRGMLVVGEIALALVLLIGAGLMVRSFARLQQVDPGFRPTGLLSLDLTLPRAKYTEQPQLFAFGRQLLERLEALPGVESAALVMTPPLSGHYEAATFNVEGRPETPVAERKEVMANRVSPGYFETMGIPLIRGRTLLESDTDQSPFVIVINETMARRAWPGQDPIGARFKWGRIGDDRPWREVVGIVADTRQVSLADEPEPEVFMPFLQEASSAMSVVVRAARAPEDLASVLRKEVLAVDPDQPVNNLRTVEQTLTDSTAQRRFQLLLLGLFASLALALAVIGIYGVLSYTVGLRTREIGIRMALGARRGDVLRMVLGQGLALVALGTAIGLAAAFALSRTVAGLLYGVSRTDPATYLAVSAMLAVVALLACYLPAQRATRVDPIAALRHE